MWKAVLAGTVAVAIAGSTIVYAQQRGRPGLEGVQRWRPNIEDMRAFGEARLAALKAGLMLTPEQEKNWAAFEEAAREYGKLRLDRMTAFASARRNPQQPQASDPIERLRRRGTAMAETGTVLRKLADTTDPLYKSLDESQKRRFAILSRIGGERMGGGRGLRGRDGFGPRGFNRRDGDGPRRFDRDRRRTENDPESFAPRGFDPRGGDGPRRGERGPRRSENGLEGLAPRGFETRDGDGPRQFERGQRSERSPDGFGRDPRRLERQRDIDRGERSL